MNVENKEVECAFWGGVCAGCFVSVGCCLVLLFAGAWFGDGVRLRDENAALRHELEGYKQLHAYCAEKK